MTLDVKIYLFGSFDLVPIPRILTEVAGRLAIFSSGYVSTLFIASVSSAKFN